MDEKIQVILDEIGELKIEKIESQNEILNLKDLLQGKDQ